MEKAKFSLVNKTRTVKARIEVNPSSSTIYINDKNIDNHISHSIDRDILCELLNSQNGISHEKFIEYRIETPNRRSEIIRRIDNLLCFLCDIKPQHEKNFIKREKTRYKLLLEKITRLDMFIGNYYMYYPNVEGNEQVRKTVIEIYKRDESLFLRLKNINNEFVGEIVERSNCIFVSLNEVEYNKYIIFLVLYSEVHTTFDTLVGVMSFSDRGIPTSTKVVLIKMLNQDIAKMKAEKLEDYERISYSQDETKFKNRIKDLLLSENKPDIISCTKKPEFSKILEDNIRLINRGH